MDLGYLVSPEELKHEMSSEKGLAWFDMGDGRIVKGRSLWVEAKTPSRWDGREHLMRFPIDKREAINLASYVNGEILKAEQSEVETDSISGEELAVPARHSEDPSVREYPSMPKGIEPEKPFVLSGERNGRRMGNVIRLEAGMARKAAGGRQLAFLADNEALAGRRNSPEKPPRSGASNLPTHSTAIGADRHRRA